MNATNAIVCNILVLLWRTVPVEYILSIRAALIVAGLDPEIPVKIQMTRIPIIQHIHFFILKGKKRKVQKL
jgi:hypothetical protein